MSDGLLLTVIGGAMIVLAAIIAGARSVFASKKQDKHVRLTS